MTNRTEVQAPQFTVDGFRLFWSNPDPALVAPVLTDDIVGHWPGSVEPVRGKAEYIERIAQIIGALPGMYLEVAEQATNGEFIFIRWVLHATSVDGAPFEATGIDRIRMRDGLVAENVIVFDSARLEELSGRKLPWP